MGEAAPKANGPVVHWRQTSSRSSSGLPIGHFPDPNGWFKYAGKLRFSLGRKRFADLLDVVRPLGRHECPFSNLPNCKADPFDEMVAPEEMALFSWLSPELTAEVKFTERDRFGALRHPQLVHIG